MEDYQLCQKELFEKVLSKVRQQGYSPNFALNNKVALENAIQTYIRKAPTKVPKIEALGAQHTLRKLLKIRHVAMITSLSIIFGIIIILAVYSLFQSFKYCDGLFGDSIVVLLNWHRHYDRFSFDYGQYYNPDNKTNLYKYPWMVRFTLSEQNSTNFMCSGFLINDRDILTAGHCFFLDEAYDIHLGGTPAKNYSDAIRVKSNQYELFVHPEYNHSLVKNDIALIKLNKPVTFSETIHPIRLSFNNFDVPQNLTLTGWNSSNPHIFPKLRERLIPTIPVRQCEYRINKTIEDKVLIEVFTGTKMSLKFCGGDIDTRIKQGDSGMPIQSMDDNGPIAYGIISVGTKSNKDGSSPQIFTNIYPYLHWILCNAGEKFYKVPDKG